MRPCAPFPLTTTASQDEQWSFDMRETSQSEDPHAADLVLVNEDEDNGKRSSFQRKRACSTATIRGRPSVSLPSVFEAWEDEDGLSAEDDFAWDDYMPPRPETPAFDTSPTKLFREEARLSAFAGSPHTPGLEDLPDIEDESSSDEDIAPVFTPPDFHSALPMLEARIHFLGTRHFEEWDKNDFVDCHVLVQLAPTDARGLLAPPPRGPLEILCSTATAPRAHSPSASHDTSHPTSSWSTVPEHALRWRSDTASIEHKLDPRHSMLVEDGISVNPSWMRPHNCLKAADRSDGRLLPDAALEGWARFAVVRVPTGWLRGSLPRALELEVLVEDDGLCGAMSACAEMTVANLRWRDVASRRL